MTERQVWGVFAALDQAVSEGVLIRRAGARDKEFHFQDWFGSRLSSDEILFDAGRRNSYPDFALVNSTEGFEIKGLAYPGREATYDCNSQAPTGFHNGRDIYYVFGRYPKDPDGNEYPVIDLVVCHGSFLNASTGYVHKNRNTRTFGSYGDIMVRDRKMYVAPTPFALLDGTTGKRTLVLPASWPPPSVQFRVIGRFQRVEADRLLAAYTFDLQTNTLTPSLVDNPNAGTTHDFVAYRCLGATTDLVSLKGSPLLPEPDPAEEFDDE